jgi:DNA-binding NtrC family response regulator
MFTILIVDDVATLAEQYAYDLKRATGYDITIVNSGKEALSRLTSEPIDCVILDLEMPVMDGFDVLRKMDDANLKNPVIVYTGTGNYDRCVQAVRLGAYGFIDKAEPMERVVLEVEKAIKTSRLEYRLAELDQSVSDESEMTGSSPAMKELRDSIRRIALIPSPALIIGESGTGKELVAREIHTLSGRGDWSKFVAINCAAIPDNLIESELFGHERGAFTGASKTHSGAFQRASDGTLFLDEIGELPLAAQAKLLRVLEAEEFVRVGGERPIKMKARIVAATNRNLDDEVDNGTFREDLLFRLNVHIISVPPLRNRKSDIPALVDRFLRTTCQRFGIRKKSIAPSVLDTLTRHQWGRNNIRELRNVIERLVIASDSDTIELEAVPAEIRMGAPSSENRADPGARTFKELRSEAERQIVLSVLAREKWQIGQAAKELGLADHASLLKIMRRLDITRPE